MKFAVIFFLLSVMSFKSSFCQKTKISGIQLLETEWFVDNKDSIYEMFQMNLEIGDTINLTERINRNTEPDSPIFGQQEFEMLRHHNYANFEFDRKSSFQYFLTSKLLPHHAIVGRMPLWQWKIRHSNEIHLFQEGEFKLALLFIKKQEVKIVLNNKTEVVRILTLIRVK